MEEIVRIFIMSCKDILISKVRGGITTRYDSFDDSVEFMIEYDDIRFHYKWNHVQDYIAKSGEPEKVVESMLRNYRKYIEGKYFKKERNNGEFIWV